MSTRFSRTFILSTLVWLAAGVAAFAAEPQASPRLAIADDPPGAALRAIEQGGALPFGVAVRVVSQAFPADAALEARLAALGSKKLPVWLAVPAPDAQSDVERWQSALRALIEKHGPAVTILEVMLDRQPARLAAFAMQVAATEVRARHDAVRIAIGGAAMGNRVRREEIYRAELAPYIDALAVPDAGDQALGAWLHGVDPITSIVVTESPAPDGGNPARRIVDAMLQDLGTDVALHAWPASEATPAALRALGAMADLLGAQISVLDPAGVSLSLRAGAADVTRSLPHRLLFDERTFATYLIYWGEAAAEPLRMTLVLPVEGLPGVHDILTGARTSAAGYTRDRPTGRVQASAPLTGRPMVIDFNEGAADVMVERSGVSAQKALTIDEVIARHQQQQRTQDAIVRSYIAHARMQQHFRPTATDSYDVVTENTYFVNGRDVEWEELSFSVNGAKWGADRPAFPILQPEKVLSLPLQLRFD